jgi:hypothetical protein
VKVTKSCSRTPPARVCARLAGWLLLASFCAASALLAGCKSTPEPENEAMTPWNKPKNWETGLPSGMWERR